jgi:hypothetical protein
MSTSTNPADRPHVYRPRVLTAANLPDRRASYNAARGARQADPWGIKDVDNRPCDICGASRGPLSRPLIHVEPQARPNLERAQAAIAAYTVPA